MDKKQFFYLFNNSLKIIINDDSNYIFFVYNKSIERQIKYNRLFNLNKPIKYTLNKDDILFKQDIKNKYLWYDYEKIYLKLKENTEYKYLEINNLIKSWLVDETNWNQYTLQSLISPLFFMLDDDINWKQYTLYKDIRLIKHTLDDDINWNQYTLTLPPYLAVLKLDDDINWNQYTLHIRFTIPKPWLIDDTNLNQYISQISYTDFSIKLNDDTNWNQNIS